MKVRLDLHVKSLPDDGPVRKQSRKVIATDGAVFVDVTYLQYERPGVAWKVPGWKMPVRDPPDFPASAFLRRRWERTRCDARGLGTFGMVIGDAEFRYQ